jgi:hypothetical protein
MPEAFEPDPICPVCHEGRLTPTYEGWYVLPSAGYRIENKEGEYEVQPRPAGGGQELLGL